MFRHKKLTSIDRRHPPRNSVTRKIKFLSSGWTKIVRLPRAIQLYSWTTLCIRRQPRILNLNRCLQIVVSAHKALIRLGFMHLVASNVCVWFATTVTECQLDFEVAYKSTPDPTTPPTWHDQLNSHQPLPTSNYTGVSTEHRLDGSSWRRNISRTESKHGKFHMQISQADFTGRFHMQISQADFTGRFHRYRFYKADFTCRFHRQISQVDYHMQISQRRTNIVFPSFHLAEIDFFLTWPNTPKIRH